MSVRDIVRGWLKAEGYEGLWSPVGDCACEIADLMPCCVEGIDSCEPGYKQECDPQECGADGDCDWHIGAKKMPSPKTEGRES